MIGTRFIAAMVLGASVAPAAAQAPDPRGAARVAEQQQKQSRYQIGVMERVLEGAVEHGVTMTKDRLQAVMPAQIQFIFENARVRGFRLDGYGIFFDVIVPSFEGTLPWAMLTLDRNNLGLDSALKALKSYVDAAKDPDLQQALRRVELQVTPLVRATGLVRAGSSQETGARGAAGSAAAVNDPQPATIDPILQDPNEAYRTEVRQALMDAMLDHSSSLGIGATEWLTVAARRNDDRAPLAPADSNAGTIVIRVRGTDLAAFLARQISREEALKRIEVRMF